jgi:hypothetical protein
VSHYKSHDEELILQMPEDVTSPFLLFHKSGVTMKIYDLIIASVEKGDK